MNEQPENNSEIKPPEAPVLTPEQVNPLQPQSTVMDTRHSRRPVWLLIGVMVLAVGLAIASYVLLARKSTKQVQVASKTSTASTSAPESTNTVKAPLQVPAAINAINPAAIPLGDGHVSTTSPQVGSVYSCQAVSGGGGGNGTGSWLNKAAGTWDSTKKVAVSGAVAWPNAAYSATISGSNRVISGNNLPINNQTTGIYPISSSDPAYAYDRNPNKITAQTIHLTLPIKPQASAQPNCLNMGAIGILNDGVVLFNALDGESRDAAAYETLDSCDGHPERSSEYHHHDIPSCIMSKYTAPNTSTLVGYANDGYGIYVERDAKGNLLTNANLDVCHGRTSNVDWDGATVEMYHYVATMEYPYTVGCFHGTSTAKQAATQQGPPPRP